MAVYEAKRRLLDVLDLQVTLFVADGKRKAEIIAKYCPNGDVLSVEGGNSEKSSIVTKSTELLTGY